MKKIIYILSGILFFGVTSCNDFLDEVPDDRTEIDSQEKVKRLLITAYPESSYMYMGEIMSDNTDETDGNRSYDVLQRELYEWGKITDVYSDSPTDYWEKCYLAIATANVALEAIEKLGNGKELNPQKGEALVCRAYAHFLLVNIFSKHYCSTSESDMGIPYVTKPETTVKPTYNRGTVAEVYKKIEKDLLEGISLIDDGSYSVKKYHFNKDAAHAFAARFYLYYRNYDKVIEYANKVLGKGDAAASAVRNWSAIGALSTNGNLQPNAYIDVNDPAVLLNVSAISSWGAVNGPFAGIGAKYTHNQLISSSETIQSTTPWGSDNAHYGTFWNDEVNKLMVRKIGYYFKVTDAATQTGYIYNIQVAFSTDETLLCRAEAYIMKKQYDEAVRDLNIFMTAFTDGEAVSRSDIQDFYNGIDLYEPTIPTVKKEINPDFTVEEGEQKNLIYCLLHVRRMLTLHEGLRWFDIKRYGIEIHRRLIGNNIVVTDTMQKDDLRKVLRLPADVSDAGLPDNPR
ncbi:RagB/SusD family nutrient uptake outer membrane protein [Bacteroides sp. 224]|uniref:RagB/SusD family nutrient uptake outer membrane protein n=1 Tax=Bacteroides sp. 224 TaxID=2302936 RepID=UPI0013CFBF8B|nr:RagB/SusD family nutrient uptake outer membrane protein [Bacteroides sp. 224]NDV65742.1 RagB/SusD family nutrient uptake outer membrane protein [Bacteroides sp. 224]